MLRYHIKKTQSKPLSSDRNESIKMISRRESSERQYPIKNTIVIIWLMIKYNTVIKPKIDEPKSFFSMLSINLNLGEFQNRFYPYLMCKYKYFF